MDLSTTTDAHAKHIHAWLKKLVDDDKLPFTQLLVSTWDNEPLFFSQFGKADVETNQDITSDTIVRLFSMTKPIVSVALMQLYEKGHFRLSDPIYPYLGEKWKGQLVYSAEKPESEWETAQQDITFGHLLSHTSGLSYGFDAKGVLLPFDALYHKEGGPSQKMVTGTLEEMVDALADQPLLFHPGTKWHYGLNTDVVGRLVEVLSGETLDAHLKEHVFRPCGMKDTDFVLPEESKGRFAACYRRKGTPVEFDLTFDFSKTPSGLELSPDGLFLDYTPEWKMKSGGGGLVGTIGDYSCFLHALVNGRLVSKKTLALMASNQLPEKKTTIEACHPGSAFIAKPNVGFGLGFAVEYEQAAGEIGSAGSFYWGGAAGTSFWVDPQEKMYVIFTTQLMMGLELLQTHQRLKPLVYGMEEWSLARRMETKG